MYQDKKIGVIIPALNEAGTIGQVVGSQPPFVDLVLVADNGSRDDTTERAREAGAETVYAPRRGYGAACLAALAFLNSRRHPDIVIFSAGDGSDDPAQAEDLLYPVATGKCDLCLASRFLGNTEKGALTPAQRMGTMLAVFLINLIWQQRFTDLAPYRAIRWSSLSKLDMSDPDFGWTVEMQIKAVRQGLGIKEIPAEYRCRRSGTSKISGTLRGTVRAGSKILSWILREALPPRFTLFHPLAMKRRPAVAARRAAAGAAVTISDTRPSSIQRP